LTQSKEHRTPQRGENSINASERARRELRGSDGRTPLAARVHANAKEEQPREEATGGVRARLRGRGESRLHAAVSGRREGRRAGPRVAAGGNDQGPVPAGPHEVHWVVPTSLDADNSAGSCTLAACNDWRRGVRRFHVGMGHHEPDTDAGYTTAGSPHLPQLSISPFLCRGSPYTKG
jgi:hypothetical protein